MRIAEAYEILRRNLSRLALPPRVDERLHDGTMGHRFKGMAELIAAVDELSRIPGLEPECATLRRTTFFSTGADEGTTTQTDWNNLNNLVHELKKIAERIKQVLKSMVVPPNPNSIAVKLPPVDDLGELRDVIGDIQLALERPVQLVLHEKVSLEGVDRGSMWLVLAGSASFVVKFTFGILYAANHYMRRQAELDRYVEHTRAVKSLNDYMAKVQDANAEMMAGLGQALTEQLLEGRDASPEAVATTLNAIKTLAELRRQGLEMQLAANAPPELREAHREAMLADSGIAELLPKVPPQLLLGSGASPPPEPGEPGEDPGASGDAE